MNPPVFHPVFSIQLDGQHYVSQPDTDACAGCAFKPGDNMCVRAGDLISCDLPDSSTGPIVWVKADLPALDDEPADDEPAPPDTKPTNPKDIVGVRKAGLSCLPMAVVAEMGVGMMEGAAKYGRHNYRAVGVRASVYFDAAMRHLIAWWEGEDVDPDSGMHHVAKLLTCMAVLREAQLQGLCTDDRPPRAAPFYAELNQRAAEVLARYADKSPRHYTIADTPPRDPA